MEQIFGFCMGKKDHIEDELCKASSASVWSNADREFDSSSAKDQQVKSSPRITDSRDVKVRFTDSDEDLSNEKEKAVPDGDVCSNRASPDFAHTIPPTKRSIQAKSVIFDNGVEGRPSSRATGVRHHIAQEAKESSELRVLHDAVRKRRILLRKIHAKLKLDLNSMQKIREILDSSKCAASANLPDVITAEQNCSEGDFMREFRQLFEKALKEITEPTEQLQDFTNRYGRMLAITPEHTELSDDGLPSQVQSESQRLINDSEKMLSMLKKAMKIAAVEYKLKLAFSDNLLSGEQGMTELETALLELQRLKAEEGLSFTESRHDSNESPSFCSVRDTIFQLFPQERILKLEKRSKLRLAELHLEALENRLKKNDARQLLAEAIKTKKENEVRSALEDAKRAGFAENDDLMRQAENFLHESFEENDKLRKTILNAMKAASAKELQKALKRSESLHFSDSDPLVAEGRKCLKELESKGEKLKGLLSDLKKATKKKDADEMQRLLIDIKALSLTTGTKQVEESTNLLVYLRKYDQELKKDALESSRIRLVSSLELDNPQDIANALLRAQMAGLSNCVEIMGARAKLGQLQNDQDRSSAELKKIEDYLDKLASRACENDATVDLITTLERAVAVAESLDVPSEAKQRARGAIHILKSRKEKVKNVKDELQRAVMECRHEAITCAIAEAESLPYFLTFDPLDGQIAAILEYAKNKLSPRGGTSVASGDADDSATRRVKSNLKRAMRSSSSAKLESAIALCRKTYSIPERQATERNVPTGGEDAAHLIQRAERKHRRMKRQEKLAEKAWINIRDTMRENLKTAMKGNDRAELWKAVYQFKREVGSNMEKDDKKLLLDARKQLREVTIQQFKSNLSNALQDRDSRRLRHSLVELESPSLSVFPMSEDTRFKDDVARAKKLLGHLNEMEKFKKSVSEMSRSQLAEIHRFPNPPTCVRAVMTATYVLLGENEKELKDWTCVLRLLVKMGRESLTRRVAICSPSRIPGVTAQRVGDMLSGLTQAQVNDVNKGAAVFFGWANCVVEEVLDRHKDDPIKPSVPQKQNRTPQKPAKDPTIASEFWNRLSRPRSSVPVRSIRSAKVEPRPTSAMK